MSKKEILEGCAVSRSCDDPCRKDHRRIYNPATKETSHCPAAYRYYWEKKKVDPRSRRRGRGKKRVQWVKVELR